jgi:hypothetical protein
MLYTKFKQQNREKVKENGVAATLNEP